MKKLITVFVLFTSLLILSCDEYEYHVDKTIYNFEITFLPGDIPPSQLHVYSKEEKGVPIATFNVHGQSRVGITQLEVGKYIIYPYISNATCEFQIKDNLRTYLKVSRYGGSEVEYKELD